MDPAKKTVLQERNFDMKLLRIVSLFRKHFRRIFKSAIVGGIGAVINLTIQYFLTEYFGLWYIYSAIIGFLFSLINNYFLNYYWTFKINEISNVHT